MSSPDKEQAVKTFKTLAETHIQSMQDAFGTTLCYDEGSIFLLDDLMGRKGISPEDENFQVIIMTVGSYLGETLIRVLGGRWEYDPELEWVVTIEGKKVSPFTLAIKKFTLSSGKSVSEWYKGFKEELGRSEE